MTDLTSLTLAEARKGLADKTFTSLELTDAHLNAIEAARVLNAFVMETPDRARDMAKAVDAVLDAFEAAGQTRSQDLRDDPSKDKTLSPFFCSPVDK